MTTQYTPILKLALPVTGELSGTWGDVVNDNITSMVEQAIAGLATISTWTGNSKTLTTANGTTSESRCAMLVAQTGSGGSALTGAGEIICPASSKLYVLKNDSAFAITLKTSAGSGVAVASGNTAFLFCDGTNVNACVTTIVDGRVTGNLTVDGNATVNGNTTLGNATSDTITATARFASDLVPSTDNARDLGSTANSWKDLYIDGTATMALVAISGGTINGVSIGGTTPATIINVDNLRLDGNTLSSTDTNGNVVIAPNGTGDVQLDADTVRVGDSGAAVTLTSNGAGALTVTTGGAADLTLSTNSGTTSGTITIANGANGNITLIPNGTGDVVLSTDLVLIGDLNTDATITTNGTGNLNLTTNGGTNSGTIQIAQGANGNITLTPNGTGSVSVPKLVWSNGTSGRVPYLTTGGQFTDDADMTFDGTTLSVNGLTVSGTATFSGGTADRVVYLNASKQATTSANLAFDGTTLTVNNLTDSSLTSGRVTYATTGGNLTDSANLTFNGTTLTANALTVSNAVTLSGGTANGVAYLNGSKVLTTGSALTFDGAANLSFTGTGLYPVIAVSPTGNNAIFGFRMDASAGNGVDWRVEQGRSAVGDFNVSAPGVNATPQYTILKNLSAQYWSIGSSEGMRLTSTGLGIGTTPSNRLHVVYGGSTVGAQFTASAGYAQMQLTAAGSNQSAYYTFNVNGTGKGIVQVNAVDALTLDSSGNVSVGISSANAKLNVVTALSGTYGSAGIWLSDNSTTSMLMNNTAAGVSSIWASGALTLGSGGNNNTERARITPSGSLLVGTTAENYAASIITANPITTIWSGTVGLRYNVSGQTNAYYKGMTGTSIQTGVARGLHIFNYDQDSNLGINFYPNNYAGQTANPAVTITSTGAVSIGNTNTSFGRLTVLGQTTNASTSAITVESNGNVSGFGSNLIAFKKGANISASISAESIGNNDVSFLAFNTSSTNNNAVLQERARITPSGDLLLGTTTNSNSSRLVVEGSGTMNGAYFNRAYNFTDISGTTWGIWRIQALSGGGGRIDLSEFGTDIATPNAAQYTITFYVTNSGSVNAVSTKLATNTTNTVLLVTSGGFLYLAVNKGHANGAGYWNMSFMGSNNTADFTFTHASNLTGYTTVYTV